MVLYHGPCNDGFTSAWAAWVQFGDEAKYYQVNYGKKIIDMKKLKGKDVFILDFSYPRETIRQIEKQAKSLLILDHHVTAEKELEGCECAVFDMTRSGAGMTWDYFHGEDTRPTMIEHVEDYDLYNLKMDNTKEIIAIMETTDKTFENWEELNRFMSLEESYRNLVDCGEAALGYRDHIIKKTFVERPSYIMFDDGVIVPAANSSIWQSEIGAQLTKDKYGFAAIWYHTNDGRIRYSLRSDKRLGSDVSKVALRYGGGGHKNAASFSVEKPFRVVPLDREE